MASSQNNGPLKLIENARKAVLKATGIDQSKNILETLNLPKSVIRYLTTEFSSSDFFINKENVTPEEEDVGIYKAVCRLDEIAVILKVFEEKEISEERRSMLNQWESIRQDGIQKCYVSFKENDTRVFVLQHMTRGDEIIGRCLATNNKLSENYIWYLLHRVCQICKYCQDSGLEYGDFRPHKIGFLNDGGVLLESAILNIDEELSAMDNMVMDDDITHGVYTPPEIINEEERSQACLIWQIGAVMYEMAALRPAYQIVDAGDIFAPLQEIMEGNLPPPLNSSGDLSNLLNQCMSLDTKSRPSLPEIIDVAKSKYDDSVMKELDMLL